MAIKSGDKGPRGPHRPLSPGTQQSAETPQAASDSDIPKVATESVETTEMAAVNTSLEQDAFDSKLDAAARRLTGGASARHLDDMLREAKGRPSMLKNMQRLLVQTQSRLLAEFDALKRRAEELIGQLASEGGVSAEELERVRPELRDLRRELAKRRRRLAAIHRRLKLVGSVASDVPEARLANRVGDRLRDAQNLSGTERDLAFFELGKDLKARGPDPRGAGILRIDIPDDADRTALGSWLAEIAPGAQIVQRAAALLAEQPVAPLSASSTKVRDALRSSSADWDTLRQLNLFHELGCARP